MKKKLLCLYAVVLLMLPTLSAAEADTLVCYDVSDFSPYTIRSYTLSYGQLWLRDTYLSNIDYFGRNLSLEVTNLFVVKPSLYLRNINSVAYGNTVNLPATAAMSYLGGELGLGAGYRWSNRRASILIGGLPSIDLALKSNSRNVNNTASLDAMLTLWLDAEATFHKRWGRVVFGLSDHLRTAIVGGMFVPEYGALYYEYTTRKLDEALHFASFHNRLAIRNRLEFTVMWKGIIFKLQHSLNLQTWHANNLSFATLQHNVGGGLVVYLRNITPKY